MFSVERTRANTLFALVFTCVVTMYYKMTVEMNYRKILRQAFEDRSLANTEYSMRAFARDINISVSTLSEILSGKKGLSPQRALEVAKLIKLPEWQTQLFVDLVARDHAKSPLERNKAKERLKEFKQENSVHIVNQTALRALTSWVDLAVLELTYMAEFKPNVAYVSQKLGVEESIIAASVARLKAANLLKQDENGKWIDASPLFSTTDGIPSDAIRRFHRTVLHLGMQKLETQGVEKRVVKSAVFSISESNKVKAKKILDEAMAKIVSLADESGQDRQDVMCFSMQLFSVLNDVRTKNEKVSSYNVNVDSLVPGIR